MIKRIYDNFNKHQLPVSKKSSPRGRNSTSPLATPLSGYRKFENHKYLLKDEIYLN